MQKSRPSEAREARLCHSHATRGTGHAPGSARRRASKRADRRIERRRLAAAARRAAADADE